MLISIPERGSTPHLVGVCLNRIGTVKTSPQRELDMSIKNCNLLLTGRATDRED